MKLEIIRYSFVPFSGTYHGANGFLEQLTEVETFRVVVNVMEKEARCFIDDEVREVVGGLDVVSLPTFHQFPNHVI